MNIPRFEPDEHFYTPRNTGDVNKGWKNNWVPKNPPPIPPTIPPLNFSSLMDPVSGTHAPSPDIEPPSKLASSSFLGSSSSYIPVAPGQGDQESLPNPSGPPVELRPPDVTLAVNVLPDSTFRIKTPIIVGGVLTLGALVLSVMYYATNNKSKKRGSSKLPGSRIKHRPR